MKLLSGRFQKDVDGLVNDFNQSIQFDARMYEEDITGSMAHAMMLGRQGIIALVAFGLLYTLIYVLMLAAGGIMFAAPDLGTVGWFLLPLAAHAEALRATLSHERLIPFLTEKLLSLGTAACPPYQMALAATELPVPQ